MTSPFTPGSDDWRAMLRLVGEVGELGTTPGEACAHLMAELAKLIGSGPVWWSVVGGADPGRGADSDGTAEVALSQVHGLDHATLQRWEQTYLQARAYGEHPMWERAFAAPGCARSFLRRDIVADDAWYRNPHVTGYVRGFGADDVVAAIVPIGGGAELCVAAMRAWGDTGFTAREREMILQLSQHTSWLAQRPDPLAVMAKGHTGRPFTIAELAPRHRSVLELLAAGHSEKRIAAALNISPRTAHKYIEQIYRALDVSSRAELMARFIAR
ncbi:hypothetical protein SSBR45G_41180 [Bradyrhizobium sp. SSBR45G]|uniref:helix-turn-helix transcriptional regulator n=1 Tax=unclassified Bradyrhizobium TaxID=2631580 RepID=UPI002342998E|nr:MULTISPECIES: LuxR C-terminal-related transcriptional regulator [unclassified Bradyrhizobium]GLH79209.1 hypothetical protein SSBR45G_41180 [Bradyrhizobium sp. SSBR45G]GLH84644.1 hypothetical protein SSBR45R_21040 [Bradyrhizobium sp. SSBR45R]